MRALGIIFAALLIGAPTPGVGQERASLYQVGELARAGRTEEARVELLRWWEEELQDATRQEVQRGLWLRGSLTVDPGQAELDFRRLVVEYPGGLYSGQALLRLAQSALAKGDSASAAAHARRLVAEYPIVAGGQDAEEWLAGLETLVHEEAPPSPPVLIAPTDTTPSPPVPAAATDTTPRTPVPAAATDTAPRTPVPAAATDTTPRTPRSSPPPSRDSTAQQRTAVISAPAGTFAVQLGAFSSEERARALHRRATAAGLEARLIRVPGVELVRVRVGVFASSAEAREASQPIEQMGFAVAVVRNEVREEPVTG
jgi:cell division septation protein DedD